MKKAIRRIIPGWAKPYTHSMIWKYRRITWANRCLPNFIIIGAQKAGTSSMYAYLCQHPQLFPAFDKEVHFFDGGLEPGEDNFKKGKPWYCAHFPLRKNMGAHQKTFEASPLYIFNPLVPQRIARLIPKVKIITLLRNPTERAISHYFHEKKKEWEFLDITEALHKEESRLKPAIEAQNYKSEEFIHYSYKSRGLYKKQLERYLRFFPRNQLLVMTSEKFFTKPNMCLRRVFEFVGVDPEYKIADLTPKNVANNKSNVASSVYDYLDSFFRSPNQELYNMLGENYGW